MSFKICVSGAAEDPVVARAGVDRVAPAVAGADRVVAVAKTLNRYPDREATKLRQALGAYLALDAGVPAIPVDEIFEVARVTIEVAELLRKQ